MAILDELPGIEVTVKINGRPAQEYDDPDYEDDGVVCKKYIESQAGAVFSISLVGNPKHLDLFGDEKSGECLEASVAIDGHCRVGKFLNQHPLHPSFAVAVSDSRAPSSTQPGMEELKLFKFQSITTVDDASKDRLKREKESAKDVGTIRVAIYKADIVGSSQQGFRDHSRGNFELSEKSLKGRSISHGTDFISGGVQPKLNYMKTRRERLLGDFYFYYRSRKDLKSELVIPRSPSPEAEVIDVVAEDVENLPPEELRRLAGERLAQINGSPAVKPERGRGVKRERSPGAARRGTPAYKMVRTDDGKDAIDLTDD